MQKKKVLVIFGSLLLLTVFFSGCTDQQEELSSVSNGEDENEEDFTQDSDSDGIPDNIDAFPYDFTQWADRDGDKYGDNPTGINPDAFPDDSTEWKDSDSDDIGDNADIYDKGNAGIKLKIISFNGDDTPEEWELPPTIMDPYFRIQLWVVEKGNNEWIKIKEDKSSTFENSIFILNPFTSIVDVNDDIKQVHVIISAWDEDIDADDHIDLNGDSTTEFDAETDFNPKITSFSSFTADGRLDLIDELDGWIEYNIEIIRI